MRPGFTVSATLLLSLCAGGQQTVTKPAIAAPPAETAPAAAAPISMQNTAPPNDSASYVIGTEDVLQITVWKETTISGPYTVRPDGMISLPLVGDVQAAGQTPAQLGTAITERLKKLIREPNVTVILTSVHPKQVTLMGEVNHVGPVTLLSGMTPLQAIAAAGGPTAYANTKKIKIFRNQNGTQKTIFFDYKKAIKDGDQQGVTLQPGDTIVIP